MNILVTAFWFLAVLVPVIFIHELGHYVCARIFSVKVQIFSIGFGKSIIEWEDSKGTLWKVATIPLGGYVKMFGDIKPDSSLDNKPISGLTDVEKQNTFFAKKLWQKALITLSGSLANYILTIFIFACINIHFGVFVNKAIISEIANNSPAYLAGLQVNDEVIDINGKTLHDSHQFMFELSCIKDQNISLGIIREGKYQKYYIEADFIQIKDDLGQIVFRPQIGLYFQHSSVQQVGILESFSYSIKKTFEYTSMMLKTLSYAMLSSDEKKLGAVGPLGVAQLSKKFGEADGWFPILSFVALISLNLGFINLLPIPMLDGGHLLLYLIEGMVGQPINLRLQNLLFKFGFLIMILFISIALWNDFKLITNG